MTIIKKFDTEEIKPTKYSKKYLIMSITGLLVLVIIEIWVSNSTVTFGEKFESMQGFKKNLVIENQVLENKIAKSASLTKIASDSASLGFSTPESIKYIR